MEPFQKHWVILNTKTDFYAVCIFCQREYHAESIVDYKTFHQFATTDLSIDEFILLTKNVESKEVQDLVFLVDFLV